MDYGLYVAAAGADAQSRRMEVLSNNLANVDTPGFKEELAVLQARYSRAIRDGTDIPGRTGINDLSSVEKTVRNGTSGGVTNGDGEGAYAIGIYNFHPWFFLKVMNDTGAKYARHCVKGHSGGISFSVNAFDVPNESHLGIRSQSKKHTRKAVDFKRAGYLQEVALKHPVLAIKSWLYVPLPAYRPVNGRPQEI